MELGLGVGFARGRALRCSRAHLLEAVRLRVRVGVRLRLRLGGDLLEAARQAEVCE